MRIKELQQKAHANASEKGFWNDATNQNFGNKIALIHSELSEALEANRKNLQDDKIPTRDGEEVELADAIIRICDVAEAYGYDLERAIIDKMEYNSKREYKHGSNY